METLTMTTTTHSKYLVTDGVDRHTDGLEISRHGTVIGDAGDDFARAVDWAIEHGPGARVVRADRVPGESVDYVLLYEEPAVAPATALSAWGAAKAAKSSPIATEPVVQALRGGGRVASAPLEVALQASLLAQDLDALRRLAASTDPTEELEDGSLLRVLKTERGFRIEHIANSAPAAPEQSWEIDERGRVIA
jgi:hypothetical protein